MIIISSICSLWPITKCDTQPPQMSVMNDLKGHTWLSKKIKCTIAFWHPESNLDSKHICKYNLPFYRDWKGNLKPKRLSWKTSPSKPSKGTKSSNNKHFESFICMKDLHKILLWLSNFNTFAATPMKTKRRWLRKSKKRRLGLFHVWNKLPEGNITLKI